MHKFFCSYNQFTQKYELSSNKPNNSWLFSTKINTQAQNTILSEIKELLQELYTNIVLIKEKENDNNKLNVLDETELLISNLYYSFFASPLELPNQEKSSNGKELQTIIETVNKLDKLINIPEYNRILLLIRNNINSII